MPLPCGAGAATGAGSEAFEGIEDFRAAPHLVALPVGELDPTSASKSLASDRQVFFGRQRVRRRGMLRSPRGG